MSETLTQMLARNPVAGAALVAGDALRLLDVSGILLTKDAMITLGEIIKALIGTNAAGNAAGSTTITPHSLAIQHLEVITISGLTATTRTMILDVAQLPREGCRLVARFEIPTTADITIEFRNAAVDGVLLTSFVTDDSGDDKVIEFYFADDQWNFLRFDSYATA